MYYYEQNETLQQFINIECLNFTVSISYLRVMKTYMKTFILFLACSLTVFLLACQSDPEPETGSSNGLSDEEIAALGISKEDAVRKLSHVPNGVVYEKTDDQLIKIDFGCNNDLTGYLIDALHCPLWDSIQTVGKLVAYYKELYILLPGYMNEPLCYNSFDYTRAEYLLAQECFSDRCSSITRNAVLEMVIEKHLFKFKPFAYTAYSRMTGNFLMAVILIKEKDADFIAAVLENTDLQNVLCLSCPFDLWYYSEELANIIEQFAIRFLSNE